MVRAILNNLKTFWLILALPAAFMLWTFVRDRDATFDLVHPSGEFSVRLMILAMMISPLIEIFGPRNWLRWLLQRRRSLGVAAFGYAVLHLGFYLVDMGDWEQIWKDALIFSIWTGYIAFVIFAMMASTSNNAAQRAMRRNWKRLQRLVYASAILVAVHWVVVDNEWRGAAIHFIPLLVLEFARLILIFNRRSSLRPE